MDTIETIYFYEFNNQANLRAMLRIALINEPQKILTVALATGGPLLLTVFGLLPAGWLNRNGLRAARAGARVALAALALALLSAGGLALSGTADGKWPGAGPIQLGVYFDRLSAVILVLAAFLLAVVSRYSFN